MENILLTLNIILAIILVLLVLMQKSEGGALGIGVSQENFMLSRSAGSFMTKATAIVATLFIICSLALTIISRAELTPTSSVLDTVEEKTEEVGIKSPLDTIVNAKLQIMNKVATIAVAFVIKFPADLENIKFSCETPIPRAPPSDFCIKTNKTNMNANMMLSVNNIFSMVVNYMIF